MYSPGFAPITGGTVLSSQTSGRLGNNNTRNAFPALQKLHTSDNIPSNDVEFSGTVLPLISSTSLTVLDLTVSLRSPSKIPEYFDEICSSAAIAPLRQLHLRIYVTSRPQCAMGMGIFARDTVTHRIPFADILPHLARLPALTDISISTESRILSNDSPSVLVALLDVCDEDLAAVAAAWPDLARLSIAYSDWAGRCRGPCMPSLGAVVALAGRCRKLERVDVEFADVDADELVRLEARASTSTSTSLGTCCTPAPGESGSGSESSQSLREVQTALRQIATVSGLRPQPPSQHRTGNIYLKYEHHERLSVAEPLRLAAALRKLFPNLRSGLEESHVVAGGMEEGLRRGDNDMVIDPETDAMRLLKALDELDLDAEL
ncbi:hypothetical protein GSI_11156 [Ganoderma sinense ZZ0214-1]|uniref:Uncharacterized protein n=1 Tax=Ganoderma sinense ZZ0214-1 TaxID=1077348 RepID=A0A2G8RZ02_9APHY|nr:hypothetical protein GSI_11156 [Ganoderma sinense ZZ0214-1]